MELDKIALNELPEEQREIAECIGFDSYKKLVRTFDGNHIYVQKADTLTKKIRNQRIKFLYNGKNINYLSMIFNLSESRIRYILSNE